MPSLIGLGQSESSTYSEYSTQRNLVESDMESGSLFVMTVNCRMQRDGWVKARGMTTTVSFG